MFDFCSAFFNKCCEDIVDVQIQETESGLRIDIKPKDPSKEKAFKEALEKCKEFCECKC